MRRAYNPRPVSTAAGSLTASCMRVAYNPRPVSKAAGSLGAGGYARRIQKICRFRFNAACSIKVFGPCCQQEIVPAAHTTRDQFPKQRGACWAGCMRVAYLLGQKSVFYIQPTAGCKSFFRGCQGGSQCSRKKATKQKLRNIYCVDIKGKICNVPMFRVFGT